ncbi:MAG: prolyl oligopeptidase family serine peptidase [Lysobacterales bacterium]
MPHSIFPIPLSLVASSLLLTLASCGTTSPREAVVASETTNAARGLTYPTAARGDVVDVHHGEPVPDPYRWLEELDSPATRAWIAAQNALTESYLADTPKRPEIKERLTELWNFERYADDRGGIVPVEAGGHLFYSKNDGLQNQYVVYVQDGVGGTPRVLLDPNTLSTDGTVALSAVEPSRDGKYIAYSVADAGSDWVEWRVRDVSSGEDLPDRVKWSKFSGAAWAANGSGFYYSGYDSPKAASQLKDINKFQKLYFHALRSDGPDAVVYERRDQPDWGFGANVSDDGRYLVISVSLGTDERNLVLLNDLGQPAAPVIELVPEFRAAYQFIGNDGPEFFFVSDDAAERYRVIAMDLRKPARNAWRTVVAEDAVATLRGADFLAGRFVTHSLRDARSELKVYDRAGKVLGEVPLPGAGTVVTAGAGANDAAVFFSYFDFTTPPSLYRLDPMARTATVFKQPTLSFDPARYETRQVFYTSGDGTRVPMFIVARKGTAQDGSNPTILYGYGGFNIPVTPAFSANTLAWLEMGGVFASANLRGGAEYGRPWHEAGMKTHKQNVFDDFAAAGSYLAREKWTRPDRLAISGRSNGGLLVAATMLQRPELFGAALPQVGVLDMLRFREFTIGWAWESDYGSVKNADEYRALRAYSPLHNIKARVAYPPTLVLTGDHDDRVYPAHSFKFVAELQHTYRGPNPMLTRIETRAGHGAGKPTTKVIEEWADVYAFLAKTLAFEPDL